MVKVDPLQMGGILNVILNALQAMEEKGSLSIKEKINNYVTIIFTIRSGIKAEDQKAF